VRIEAIAELPSRFGRFQILGFWNNRDARSTLPSCTVMPCGEDVRTRLHSSCLTG